jgi:hypothetical protein
MKKGSIVLNVLLLLLASSALFAQTDLPRNNTKLTEVKITGANTGG